jgi:phytoene/squalene synthetase
MTNIIRDVGRIWRMAGSIFRRRIWRDFRYSETELMQRHYNDRFVQLMEFQARRARQFSLIAAALPLRTGECHDPGGNPGLCLPWFAPSN